MFLVKLDFANANAVLKAHRDFRKMRKEYTQLPERDILSRLPGANHNAVLEHYLLGRKRIEV